MTPKEALEILEEVKQLDDTLYAYSSVYMEALEVAISTLKEGQQYHKIGTVEECRQAVEKQEAERVEYETNAGFSNGFSHYRIGKCPICDNRYNSNDEINYCSKCGQKLDWSEEDE